MPDLVIRQCQSAFQVPLKGNQIRVSHQQIPFMAPACDPSYCNEQNGLTGTVKACDRLAILGYQILNSAASRGEMIAGPDAAISQTRHRQPDITQARGELGWQPTVALEQELVSTIGYFRKVLSEQATV